MGVDIKNHLEKSLNEAEAIREISALLRSGQVPSAVARWAEWDFVSPKSIGRWQGIDFRDSPNEEKIAIARSIMEKMPGERGIYLATMNMLGEAIYGSERNVITAAMFEHEIATYRRSSFIDGIVIHSSAHGGDCPACIKVRGCFRLPDAPELPPKNCTCESGSSVWWTPVFEYEQPPSPWRT